MNIIITPKNDTLIATPEDDGDIVLGTFQKKQYADASKGTYYSGIINLKIDDDEKAKGINFYKGYSNPDQDIAFKMWQQNISALESYLIDNNIELLDIQTY